MAKNSDFNTQESITQMAKHNAHMQQIFNSQNNIFNYNEDNFLDKNDDGLGDLHKLNINNIRPKNGSTFTNPLLSSFKLSLEKAKSTRQNLDKTENTILEINNDFSSLDTILLLRQNFNQVYDKYMSTRPKDSITILDYNKVVKQKNGTSEEMTNSAASNFGSMIGIHTRQKSNLVVGLEESDKKFNLEGNGGIQNNMEVSLPVQLLIDNLSPNQKQLWELQRKNEELYERLCETHTILDYAMSKYRKLQNRLINIEKCEKRGDYIKIPVNQLNNFRNIETQQSKILENKVDEVMSVLKRAAEMDNKDFEKYDKKIAALITQRDGIREILMDGKRAKRMAASAFKREKLLESHKISNKKEDKSFNIDENFKPEGTPTSQVISSLNTSPNSSFNSSNSVASPNSTTKPFSSNDSSIPITKIEKSSLNIQLTGLPDESSGTFKNDYSIQINSPKIEDRSDCESENTIIENVGKIRVSLESDSLEQISPTLMNTTAELLSDKLSINIEDQSNSPIQQNKNYKIEHTELPESPIPNNDDEIKQFTHCNNVQTVPIQVTHGTHNNRMPSTIRYQSMPIGGPHSIQNNNFGIVKIQAPNLVNPQYNYTNHVNQIESLTRNPSDIPSQVEITRASKKLFGQRLDYSLHNKILEKYRGRRPSMEVGENENHGKETQGVTSIITPMETVEEDNYRKENFTNFSAETVIENGREERSDSCTSLSSDLADFGYLTNGYSHIDDEIDSEENVTQESLALEITKNTIDASLLQINESKPKTQIQKQNGHLPSSNSSSTSQSSSFSDLSTTSSSSYSDNCELENDKVISLNGSGEDLSKCLNGENLELTKKPNLSNC